jgi:putative phosphoesterase
MAKLLVTADIHGNLPSWNKVAALLRPGDTLAVAGDLFDTRYGDRTRMEFKPEIIRKEFKNLKGKNITAFYVYGNCDTEDFLEGHGYREVFEFEGATYLLTHGHHPMPDISGIDVVIEGHSHTPRLDTLFGKIFLNPGSLTFPRYSEPSYAIVENGRIFIVNGETGKTAAELAIGSTSRDQTP